MRQMNRADVQELVSHTGLPRVSIYLPAQGVGPAAAADEAALRSAVQRAGNLLLSGGTHPEEVRRLLQPITGLTGIEGGWHRPGGIAVFAAPGWFRGYRLGVSFQPVVHVGGRFLTRPLLPLIGISDRLLVLAMSGRTARLIAVEGEGAAEIPAGLPQGLENLPWRTEAGRDVQFHQLGRQVTAHGQPLYHGHGGAADTASDRMEEYLRHVESLLRPVLRAREEPLVLAGAESVVAMYRKICTYPHLAGSAVAGNPDDIDEAGLAEHALAEARPELARRRLMAARRHARLAGGKRTAAGIEEVLPAAHDGRVLDLFLAIEAETWGLFEPSTGTVKITGEDGPGAEDLLDVAAQVTLAKGGDVYALPLEDMPGDPPHRAAVAVLRY